MKTLATLKKQAQSSTSFRGHRMKWHEVFGRADGPKSQIAHCIRCGKEVMIAEKPAPNGIDIGGEAVALNCSGQKFSAKSL